jgi:hypothetical protein
MSNSGEANDEYNDDEYSDDVYNDEIVRWTLLHQL